MAYINKYLPLDERFMVLMCTFILENGHLHGDNRQIKNEAIDIIDEIIRRDEEVENRKVED